MSLKSITRWIDETGLSPPAPPWTNGNWKVIMDILARLLTDSLAQWKQSAGPDDSTLIISFNSLRQMSEDVLGIPLMVVEADLHCASPSVHLAMLAAVICIKSSTALEPKKLERIIAPKLNFELEENKSGNYGDVNCAVCLQHVCLIERMIVQKRIYHRKCFVCSVCGKVLHRFSQREKAGKFECYKHLPTALLASKWDKQEHRLLTKPLPPPKPASLKSPLNNSKILVEKDVNIRVQESGANEFIHGISEIPGAHPIPLPRKTFPTAGVPRACEDDPETPPIPPPRPKRKSFLQQRVVQDSLASIDSISTTVTTVLKSFSSAEDVCKSGITAAEASVVDYPGFLNPFGSDDEDCTSDNNLYDHLLNPFSESQDGDSAIDYPSSIRSRASSTLTTSYERPKSQPPPPPPPKPPRAMKFLNIVTPVEEQSVVSSPRTLDHHEKDEAVSSTKSNAHQAAQIRQINLATLTEESYDSMSVKSIADVLDVLDEKLDLSEMEGKTFEEEMLSIIEQNETEWMKNDHISRWITVFEKHCSLLRQQTVCVKKWMEKFLERIHSETELQLRHLIENEGEKSADEVKREAQLLELLVDIINQKSLLVESKMESDLVNKDAKKSTKRIKTRLKKLKKKLSKQGKSADGKGCQY